MTIEKAKMEELQEKNLLILVVIQMLRDERQYQDNSQLYLFHILKGQSLKTEYLYLGKTDYARASAGEPEIKNTNSDMKELDLKWEAEPSERSRTEIVGKL